MISRLSGDYPQIWNAKIKAIDYSAPECHIAYAYTYMAANADLIFSLLRASGEPAKNLLSKSVVKVVSVGGEPGTEMLGIFKFNEHYKLPAKDIQCLIYDHNAPWCAFWPTVAKIAPAGVTASIGQSALSLTDPDSIDDVASISNADVITFSYSLSEAWRYDEEGKVSATVKKILDAAKAGSLILYSDNAGEHFDPHMAKAFCERADLQMIAREDRDHMLVGRDEESSVLAEYTKWLNGRRSKLTGHATLVAFEKS